MSHDRTTISSTLASSAAFAIIGVGLAVAAWWLAGIVTTTHESAAEYGARLSGRADRASFGMMLLAIVTALGALFFLAVAGYTLWLGLTKFRTKPPTQDDSWKDMPYPKG